MKLAFKELVYYKFKYLMITFILFLLAFLVLFVSSLAQGLSRDNISMIDQLDASYYVIHKDADHQLTQSALTKKDQKILDDNHIDKFSMKMVPMKNNITVAMVYGEKKKPELIKGHLPKNKDEIAVDAHLTEKLKLNDTIKLKNDDTKYKVTGFVNDEMYAHTPVAFVTKDGYKKVDPTVTPNIGLLKEKKSLKLDKAEIISTDQLKKGIPSYEAEQMPLQLMVVFLFVISAIVIASFFYVITIQKSGEYGILKAIGINNSKIMWTILAEVLLITIIGVGTAIGIVLIIGGNMPVTMPFYLNQNNLFLLAGLFLIVAIIGAVLSLVKVINIDPKLAIGGE